MNAKSQGDQRVHLNSAGLGRMPAAVLEVLTEWTRFEDRYGPYELEERLDDVVNREIHERLAALLGAPSGDTALCTGAADVFAAVLPRLPLGPRDRVWTTPYESAAHLTALFALRARTGCRLDVVPLRPDGDLDLEWMASHAGDDLALVSVTHVPAGCGIVNPVEEIGRILAPHRCLYAVDASYAVGQLPVDVARIGCHLLTGDGWRFLRGPQSVGFAYAAPQLRQALAPHGGLPLMPPHGAAVAALNAALTRLAPVTEDLGARLRAAVENTPGTGLIVPGRVQSGIATFTHEELPAALLRRRLADRGIVVWKTVAQETPLYLPGRGVVTAVRASVHPDNRAEDIELFADALQDAVAEGRPRSAHVPRPPFTAPALHTVPFMPSVSAAVRTPSRRVAGRGHLTLVSDDPSHTSRLQPGA
ncbi:aminotransferase class V-fold PLP-dependent enzyme [Streptomyces sp. NPDC049541]|uniref:aminotransferase class V-fold PLP-dependent enzyme n=1 Tax=Streptomyces sp. NPDC049541 TaxID=3365594 RepID=UPI0037B28AB6